VKLNFNTSKHDAKVEQAVSKEEQQKQERDAKRVKKLIHTAYTQWVKKLKSKPRTPKDILEATYQLQALLGSYDKACKNVGLEDFHKFTMEIVEDKLAQIVATDIVANNQITMFVPDHPTMLDDDNDRIVREQLQRDAKPVTFRTLDELKAIPFVKAVIQKSGFVGLCLHSNGLVGVFRSRDVVPIGFLVNGVGVENLPTTEAFAAAIDAIEESAAATDGGSAATEPSPAPAGGDATDASTPSPADTAGSRHAPGDDATASGTTSPR
jgi:hypothetical protein